MSGFGIQNAYAPLRRVLVKRPDEAFVVDDPKAWNYTSRPDLDAARGEHDVLVEILRGAGAEVVYHDEVQKERADAIYVFDPVLMTEAGAIVLSPGKAQRAGEQEALSRRLEALDIPILARIEGEGRAEGGDLLRLDEKTLVAGLGFRTNPAGVARLRSALEPLGVEVLAYDLPYFQGPVACLHLLSMISMLDEDLAVVYPPLMPVAFWRELEKRRIRAVEVPEEEFPTQAPNVLALAPRKCLMLEGNPVTQERLESAGCEVLTYRGREISLKAEGGPTCLTQPLLRQA